MKSHTNPSDERVLSAFQTKKALTIEELSEIQQCSHITSRRRLKQWGALTSYNQNNRYYTLPSIPVFSKEGLWHYQGVSFSKHGTCKQTVIRLVRKSKKGLSNTELSEVLGENPNSLLAHFKEIPGIVKERHGRDVVYFSDTPEKHEAQKRNRFPPEPAAIELTPDAQAIIMLVELIQHPGMSVDELSAHLQGKGHTIKAESIRSVFQKYGIDKKKLNMRG
ncbi:MAG: hypothetical protein EOM68_15700 [Spirochaetia bacterium]|nr:hypothetical protein [Spirochaetia bacterium]